MISVLTSVGIVVLTSALCSLFEAVLYSVPFSHIESLAESGRRSGRILRRLRESVDAPITAILSLNTISNTGGAALSGALAVKHLTGIQLTLFPIVFTLLILFVAEILPKTAGVVYSRPLAAFVAAPLQVLVWTFMPFIWMSRLATGAISKGLADAQVSEKEIMSMTRLGLRTGGVEKERAVVIQNVLSLGDRTARDIMTPRTVVFALPCSMTVEDARRHEDFLSYSRVPLYDKDADDIVGVAHRREVLATAVESGDTALEKLMHPVHFVIESMALDRLLRKFLDEERHMVVALDEFGGFSGVVTLEDVIEEILGKEIVDEFDEVADMRELARERRKSVIEESMRAKPDAPDDPR